MSCTLFSKMSVQTQSDEGLTSYGAGVVQAALLDGLPMDLSGIDPHPVRRNLRPNSKKAYAREMEIWTAYAIDMTAESNH